MKITLARQLLGSARRLIEAADRTAASELTQGMLETLVWAQAHDGYVVAGHDLSRDGSRYFFSAGSVRALGARGLAELKISPDGGVAATLTDAGRAHDVLAGPVGDRLVSVDGGEPVSLREFAKLNEGLDLFRYVRLKVDDTIREGGGAAARFKIKRVASPRNVNAWDQSVLPVSQDEMNGMDDDERRALLYEELCRAGDMLEAVADAFRKDLGVDRDAVDQAAKDVIQLAKRLNS